MAPGGLCTLRRNYEKSALVYSTFWSHLLYGTPIFDMHTNRAYHWFMKAKFLRERDAALKCPKHWCLYAEYCNWFAKLLLRLQSQYDTITDRDLDRSLLQWGRVRKGGVQVKLFESPII